MRQHDRHGATTRRCPPTFPIKQHRTGYWSITGGDPVTSRPETTERRHPVPKPTRSPYPALAAWRARNEHSRKFERWRYDNLWRAACTEAEAAECRDNPERERELQREAMALLLGEPLHKVRLTRETMRRYLEALATNKQNGAA